MIYEYFRATGAYEAIQGPVDLVSLSLQNDDVQDFDVRGDHALLTVSEMPSLAILAKLYKSKLQVSIQLQTVMALYDQEVARNNGTPTYQQFKTAVTLHDTHMMRNRNFRVRSDVVERGSVTMNKNSCSFIHDPLASGNRGQGQRRKGRSSSPASLSKATQTDGEGQKSS